VRLYHYTCEHTRAELGDAGVLLPLVRLLAPDKRAVFSGYRTPLLVMVWGTDLDEPRADALGLTRAILKCDRTEYRYRVLDPMNRWGRIRHALDPMLVDELELAVGAEPAHWYYSTEPVRVELDPI
jgi:hypothetical protein